MGKGRGGFPGGMNMGGMNLNSLMKEAKKMQAQMEQSQEELSKKIFEASAGGGAVNVKVFGTKVVKELTIDPDVVNPDDVEMLQDLIISALNEAFRKVDEAASQDFGKFNMPGLF